MMCFARGGGAEKTPLRNLCVLRRLYGELLLNSMTLIPTTEFGLPKRAELRIITLNPRLLNGISRCHTYIAHSYNLDSGLPISVSRLII